MPIAHFTASPWRRIFCSLFLVAAIAALVAALASSDAVGQRVGGNAVNIANKIAPWVMEHTANGQQAEFFVVLADQADLSAAANLQTKAEKGRFVLSNPVRTRRRRLRGQSCNGCANAGLSINPSTSLTQSW